MKQIKRCATFVGDLTKINHGPIAINRFNRSRFMRKKMHFQPDELQPLRACLTVRPDLGSVMFK